MAESRFKSPHPSSHIPVMSPRRSESTSTIPSSVNVPNLSLVHPNRRPPGSAGGPSQSFQSTAPSTSNNGFSSLRNLRNFLPFGNTKAQAPPVNAHGYDTSGGSGSTSKKPLAALGAVRRSMAVDRKPSWTTSASGDGSQSGDQDEVMVIEAGALRRNEGRSTSDESQVGSGTRRSLSPPIPPPKDIGTSSFLLLVCVGAACRLSLRLCYLGPVWYH